MHINLLSLILLSVLSIQLSSLKFLQLSDFHYDVEYNSNGIANQMCHENSSQAPSIPLGQFGDYLCDSPAKLIENAVAAAAKVIANPDVLLWTGDNVPHIEEYNEEYVKNALQFTTSTIQRYFKDVTVLPTLGNHDMTPSNQFGENDKVYEITVELWDKWLTVEEKKLYRYGGYYSRVINNEYFLILNTNLYYTYDKRNFTDPADPAGQFAYTEKILEQAQKNKVAAHIIAHIPPGLYERVPGTKWFTDASNKRFMDILTKYKDTIKLLVFGHHHGDTFHVIRDDKDNPINVAYISPAVTPWYSGLGFGANNPSFRIFDYDEKKAVLNDVLTYNVNLTALNQDQNTLWALEYSHKEAYGMSDLSAASYANLVDGFSKNETLFQKYMLYNTVSTDDSVPNGTIRTGQLCSLNHADYEKYEKCLKGSSALHYSSWFIVTLFVLILNF